MLDTTERQLTIEDELRIKRSVRQMQLDALKLASQYMEAEEFKPYRDVTCHLETLKNAIYSKPGDDLSGVVFQTVTFIENFEPMVYPRVANPMRDIAVRELSAAHLAYHGRMDLAMITLGYGDLVDTDEVETLE